MRMRILTLGAALAIILPTAASGQTPGLEAVVGRPGIGTLVTALDGLEQEVHELQSLGRLRPEDIRVVGIGGALASDEIATFQDALSRNRAQVVALRKFLTTADLPVIGEDAVRVPLRHYLGDAGVGVRHIVAVSVTGGTVTFFAGSSVIVIDTYGVTG